MFAAPLDPRNPSGSALVTMRATLLYIRHTFR